MKQLKQRFIYIFYIFLVCCSILDIIGLIIFPFTIWFIVAFIGKMLFLYFHRNVIIDYHKRKIV